VTPTGKIDTKVRISRNREIHTKVRISAEEIGARHRFRRSGKSVPGTDFRALVLTVCAMLALPAGSSQAHLGNISYADFDVRGSEVSLQFRYAAHVTPGLPKGDESLATRARILELEPRILDWLDRSSSVEAQGRRCTLAIDNLVGPDSNEDLTVLAVWTCDAKDIRGLHIRFQPLAAVLGDWQTIATIKLGGASASTVLSPGATRWTVGDPGAPPLEERASANAKDGEAAAAEQDGKSSSFGRFFALGVHHIWTGYDHLLFLLAVLLAGGGIARLAAIVTSFTLAHSITLGAAATGLVQLPVQPVEAVIALSIVYVAVENLLGRGGDRRAVVTFFFGLIHGFGFASVLSETALPPSGVVLPLLAFNLGVEAGQLAVVAVVLPPLALALRSRRGTLVRNTLSILVALAGAAWAIERIAGIVSS
jgi:hydrogenase/urease accessory protein HupE